MKKISIIILILSSIALTSAITKDDGRAGATGSPGETTCNTTQCHTGNVVNSGGGSVVITAPTMPGWEYVPGQVYPISVTVSKPGVSLFGLGFEALRSTGANAGLLSITNTVQTQIKNAVIGANVRNNVVHKLNGGATANTHTFSFNWTAPVAGTGTITFYSAGNAASGNGTSAGDFIYTTSQPVTEFTIGIEDISLTSGLKIYPNPVSENSTISFTTGETSSVEIILLDVKGKQVQKILSGTLEAGEHVIPFSPVPGIAKGIYFVKINLDSMQGLKKIAII